MAKQTGIFRLRGTLGGLTFYRLNGKDYVRRKSGLDRRRVMSDPAFARSRDCAFRFGLASRLAKHLYRQLPVYKRRRYPIGKLTAAAVGLLQKGNSPGQAYLLLADRYIGPSAAALLHVATMLPCIPGPDILSLAACPASGLHPEQSVAACAAPG